MVKFCTSFSLNIKYKDKRVEFNNKDSHSDPNMKQKFKLCT
jgi:hypothetical protein